MAETGASPELGAVIALDHFNCRVPEHGLATAFFIEGLGLTRDPYRMVGTGNMWVNIGRQQVHLPIGAPVPFAGELGLVLPDLDEVRGRLAKLAPKLAGTAFAWGEAGPDTLTASSPWGVALRLHAAGSLPCAAPLGLAYVSCWIAPGKAEGVARFYRQVLHCPVTLEPATEGPDRGAVARVNVGPHQQLRFVERAAATPAPHSHHVALYVTRYAELYAAAQALETVMEPDAGEQFRFNRIVDPQDGTLLLHLEHEVRSLYHRDYARPLVNRGYTAA